MKKEPISTHRAQKFIDLVLNELGIQMVNEEKVERAVYGMATSRGLVDGLGEDASAEDILAKYDDMHGFMKKGAYKIKHGTFVDKKTKKFIENPKIILLIKMNGEYVEQPEEEKESLEVKVAKKQTKKK